MKRISTSIFSFVLFSYLFLFPSSSHSWGFEVHKAITQLTWMHLTDNTKQVILAFLDEEEAKNIELLGVWADQVRRDRRETAPWHYINVPYTSPDSIQWKEVCPEEGCVASAILHYYTLLKEQKDLSLIEKAEALKFLMHFIQDAHQPLHVADNADRGGNDTSVTFFGRENERLHRIWDSGLFYASEDSTESIVARLSSATPPTTIPLSEQSLEIQLEHWLGEGKDIVRENIYGKLDESNSWDADYLKAVYPIAETQVLRASIRLAMVLNDLFDE